jgi:hypothetical protein
MAVPAGHRANLDTICEAATNGDLAVLEVTRKDNGEPAYLLVAVGWDGNEYVIAPLAQLFDGDPYEQFVGPAEE